MKKERLVRQARPKDIQGIQALLNDYAKLGALLPRTRQDILDNLEQFCVIEVKDEILACGSLENFSKELAEIRSLMVKAQLKQTGYGRLVVEHLIELAKESNVQRLMALTYVPEFFHKFNFKTVDKDIFPEKVWGICVNCYKFHNCDEIAVLLELN